MAQFKLLPNTPPPQVAESLKASLDLPKKSLQMVNTWLRTSVSLVATLNYDEVLFRMEREVNLPRRDLIRVLNAIFNIGVLIEDDAKFSDALDDLRLLELTDDQLDNFKTLMENLRFPEGSLYVKVLRAVNTGIPTVADVRAVCDLRAVFEEVASPDSSDKDLAKLRALVPVVVLSLDIEDESSNVRSVVVQLSETSFARFSRVITNTALQLARMKEIGKTASLDLSRGE